MLFDSREKAHIEHAVGFIQHRDADAGQMDDIAVEEILHAAGRGNDNLCDQAHALELRVFAHAADNGRGADARALGHERESFVDLHGEFAGRREHERLRTGGQGLLREQFENRQGERKGFARTGLRRGENIAPFERGRDRLRLNRRGHREFVACKILPQDRREN